MLRWCPDDPYVALSGRGVALGEDSSRIGVLGTGNWKPGVGEYPTPYICISPVYLCVNRKLSHCCLNGLNQRYNWWLLHIYMFYLPVNVNCLIMRMCLRY